MRRAVVNVATGSYVAGQERLTEALAALGEDYLVFRDRLPPNSPSHQEKPYGFKPWALEEARVRDYELVLWADASILPVRSLEPLWARIEQQGYWFSANGYSNYEWTADDAYPDLFRWPYKSVLQQRDGKPERVGDIESCRRLNRQIQHVVATTFGLSLRHDMGRYFLREYIELAQSDAFKGPWKNTPQTPCGPADVRGHRHDQTAASVIAWRMGYVLTRPPEYFAYANETDGRLRLQDQHESTLLVASGAPYPRLEP